MLFRNAYPAFILSILIGCSTNKPTELITSPTIDKTTETKNNAHKNINSVPQKAAAEPSYQFIPPVQSFTVWRNEFKAYALAQGIKAHVFDQAFKGITPDPEVVKADYSQPEFTRPIWEYLKSAVSDLRIKNGEKKIVEYQNTLAAIEQQYQVDQQVIMAIWGMESGFGAFTGKKQVVRSLATLAYEGRRASFAKEQLIAALQILQNGDVTPPNMLGSWAGAMGQTQFIPTTYLAMAVDFDQDGHRNIWTSIPDALASTANYLAQSKWQYRQTWGHEIKLPNNFNYALTDIGTQKTVLTWQSMGITLANGQAIPTIEQGLMAAIILPAGAKGPAFIVYPNFFAIMKYNNSTSYALAVSLLMDHFKHQDATIKGDWPVEDKPLSRTERIQLQSLLNAHNYNAGYADGVIGANTRKAIRSFQQSQGLAADGYPSYQLLNKLKSSK